MIFHVGDDIYEEHVIDVTEVVVLSEIFSYF